MSKALAAKGLVLDAVDKEKMNLWDLNNNQKYTEIKGSEPGKKPAEEKPMAIATAPISTQPNKILAPSNPVPAPVIADPVPVVAEQPK